MIPIIERSGDERLRSQLMLPYTALARFAEADGTEDGREMALYYHGKVRDLYKSEGKESLAALVEAHMENTKQTCDGDEQKQFGEQEMLKEKQLLKNMRNHYENAVRKYGEDASISIQSGIVLSQRLHNFHVGFGLESMRLSNKLVTISRRVHGPDHQIQITKEAESAQELCAENE